jgi:ERCC4-related helicase
MGDSDNQAEVNKTAGELKIENPKLFKLEGILIEHFERARAVGNSSRAIVFSQWRYSVDEIVNVLVPLSPLLRPNKFVGQSSGSSNENSDVKIAKTKGKKSSAKVGMNQKEQQRVIREFRNGDHNVLVCTW